MRLVATLAVFLLAAGIAHPAPVPPAPRLTDETTAGEYELRWFHDGGAYRVRVDLRTDGTYTQWAGDESCVGRGQWWTDREGIVLVETHPETGRVVQTWRYVPCGKSVRRFAAPDQPATFVRVK